MLRLTFILALVSISACSNDVAPTETSAVGLSWQQRQQQALQHAPESQLQHLRSIDARKTRAGFMRFTSSQLRGPAAAAILLEKAQNPQVSDELRAAAIEAIPRTEVDYSDAMVALLPEESSALVRTTMIATLRRASDATAVVGLRRGLADGDPAVRAEAARVAGRHSAGTALADDLLAALGDADSGVKAAAAHALGTLHVDRATDALVRSLSDVDADVRLQSLHALGRLEAIASIPLRRLVSDSDPRIVNEAVRLSASIQP